MKLNGIELKAGMRVRFSSVGGTYIIFPTDIFEGINEEQKCKTEFIGLLKSGWMPIEPDNVIEILEFDDLRKHYMYVLNHEAPLKSLWKRDDIKIAGNTVVFNRDSITIGCTVVDGETVNKIYQRLNKE